MNTRNNMPLRVGKGRELKNDIFNALNSLRAIPRSTSLQNATAQQLRERNCSDGVVASDASDDSVTVDNVSSATEDSQNRTPNFGGDGSEHTNDDASIDSAVTFVDDADGIANPSRRFVRDWCLLFNTEHANLRSRLQTMGLQFALNKSPFRTICWRLYLNVLPYENDKWLEKCNLWRQKYISYRRKFLFDPHDTMLSVKPDLQKCNPLSLAEDSPWQVYFRNNELQTVIAQDVMRTFPENEFFRRDTVRKMMVDILFCYSQISRISYKQGMHEVLAPVIYIVHSLHPDGAYFDQILNDNELESSERGIVHTARALMDADFVEHDAFSIFYQIMQVVEPWYITGVESDDNTCTPPEVESHPFQRPQDSVKGNVVIDKLTAIQDRILKKHDTELYQHLESLEIAPQIYGLRWLRLLFGRELRFEQLFLVWDAIFAIGEQFQLAEFVLVAMLSCIRDKLIGVDFADVLTTLMRYPAVPNIYTLIENALFLYDPVKYTKPGEHVEPSRSFVEKFSFLNRNRRRASRRITLGASDNANNRSVDLSVNVVKRGMPKRLVSSRSSIDIKEGNSGGDRPSSLPVGGKSKGGDTPMREGSLYQIHTPDLIRADVDAASAPNTPLNNVRLPKKTPRHLLRARGSVCDGAAASSLGGFVDVSVNGELQYAYDQVREFKDMREHCSSMMDVCLQELEINIYQLPADVLAGRGHLFVAIAALKQVRDILHGTIPFKRERLLSDGLFSSLQSCKESATETDSTVTTSISEGDDLTSPRTPVADDRMSTSMSMGNMRL